MKTAARRLLRLAHAQAQMVQLLEARVASEQQRRTALARARDETLSILDGNPTGGAFYSAALRQLAGLGTSITESEKTLSELSGRLRQAKGREDAMSRRAGELTAAAERQSVAEEAREVTLGMLEKAPGKHSMVK